MYLWNENRSVIQVYLGANVLKNFTPPDKLGYVRRLIRNPSSNPIDFSFENEGILQVSLAQHGITIPKIDFFFTGLVTPDLYVAYIGVLECVVKNYRDKNPFELIEEQALRLTQNMTLPSDIKQGLKTGAENLKTDIQTASFDFAKTYFNASLHSESVTELIYSAINMCALNMINGLYDRAERLAFKACIIAGNNNVLDFYAKFYAYVWLAAVYAKQDKSEKAIKAFKLAQDVAKNANETLLTFSALWNTALLLVSMGQLEEAHDALLSIANLPIKEEHCSFEFLSRLLLLTAEVGAAVIQRKNDQIRQLQDKIATLSRSFGCVVAELLPVLVKVLGNNAMLWLSAGVGSSLFGRGANINIGHGNRIVDINQMNNGTLSC